MCGIAGAIGQKLSAQRIKAALDALNHRGPDGHGVKEFHMQQGNVTLIHTRLAILDLDKRSNQPFEKDGVVLTFNGEIYNYRELREELILKGECFRTESDTEVLLSAYRHWGDSFLDHLEGMWAFVLVDKSNGRILISRDRFGEKPLYTMMDGETFYFASEIKALMALVGKWADVNLERVRRFLVMGYKSIYKRDGETYFKGVQEFKAASYAEIGQRGLEKEKKYWNVEIAQDPQITQKEAIEEVRYLLRRSLELRLRADVPLAFCLSGGIDSGVLAGVAVKEMGMNIESFSIVDEDPRYDERDMLERTVQYLECRNYKVFSSREGFFERMDQLVSMRNAPVVTLSYYMHSFLSEEIARQGYKVAISGTAADEIFTGYYDHYSMWLAARYQDNPHCIKRYIEEWKEGYGSVVRNPILKDPLHFVHYPGERGHILLDREAFNDYMVAPVFDDWTEKEYPCSLLRKRMMNELFYEATPVILHEDDRNSMMYSLENRSPFLDRAIVEFMARVPDKHLIGEGMAKYILRMAGEGVMDDQVRLDKRKRGFNASIVSLLNLKDENVRSRLLEDSPIFEIFDRKKIENLFNSDVSRNSFSKFVFSFISAKLFLDNQRYIG